MKKQSIYPIDSWSIEETSFDINNNYRNETTFALSNGFIGTRGTFEEAYEFSKDIGLEGNFINGFYESCDVRYGEWNYGFPQKSQTMLNLPNAKFIRLRVNDEPLDMRNGKIEEYARTLHMDKGTLERRFIWQSPNGNSIEVCITRLVSHSDKNVMAIRYCVTPLNFEGIISFETSIDANVENSTRKTNPLVDYGPFGRCIDTEICKADNDTLFYQGITKKSKLAMGCGCTHAINTKNYSKSIHSDDISCTINYDIQASLNQEIVFNKYIVYATSTDICVSDIEAFITDKLTKCLHIGFEKMERMQKKYMDSFWDIADVKIHGNDELQQGIRFNLFHIMQSAGKDGKTSMGAKGLSGEGYEGHYFWDTEMYILPVFIYTAPQIAKQLLNYRYNTLDKARDRAKVLGHPCGALFPWRTINGEEASTYFPLGTAQYHINADIAYAFWQYYIVTGDIKYLIDKGAELLCETARVFADVGSFADSRNGKYCICSVTGPDEYNAIVDNNFYTNLMARENIRYALRSLEIIKEENEIKYLQLVEKLQITETEISEWEKIMDKMYFPYEAKLGIFPQDDGFMIRKPWDDSKIPPEKRHLLYENYHPLFIYRQQMSKQADVILGLQLHSQYYSTEELKRNYDYYQKVTLHHSSLSTCVFGILASRIGYSEEAYNYFSESARMDLDDYHNNFYAGIHAANMAGTWLAIVNGFAGLRIKDEQIEFSPMLPSKWSGYDFKIVYKKAVLSIAIRYGIATFTLLKGRSISFMVANKLIKLSEEGEKHCERI